MTTGSIVSDSHWLTRIRSSSIARINRLTRIRLTSSIARISLDRLSRNCVHLSGVLLFLHLLNLLGNLLAELADLLKELVKEEGSETEAEESEESKDHSGSSDTRPVDVKIVDLDVEVLRLSSVELATTDVLLRVRALVVADLAKFWVFFEFFAEFIIRNNEVRNNYFIILDILDLAFTLLALDLFHVLCFEDIVPQGDIIADISRFLLRKSEGKDVLTRGVGPEIVLRSSAIKAFISLFESILVKLAILIDSRVKLLL